MALRAGWGCLKQLIFNFVFSIKLNVNLKNEIVLYNNVRRYLKLIP